MAQPQSPQPAVARRRPGVAEIVLCWAAWLLLSAVTALIAFTSLFVMAFAADFPDQQAAADRMFGWGMVSVGLAVVAPVGMIVGHLLHRHIWYWPALYGASVAWTGYLVQSL